LNSCGNESTSLKSADEYQPFKTFKPFNRVAPFKPFNINELVQIVQAVQSQPEADQPLAERLHASFKSLLDRIGSDRYSGSARCEV
jgi:hypothetical protein